MIRLGEHTRKKSTPPEAYTAWQADPSPGNFTSLWDTLKPVVGNAMTSFGGSDPKLRTRARILTAQALQSYDPAKGASLNTHVYNHLQRLQRYRAERGRVTHVPEGARLDAANVLRFESEYTDRHGFEPPDATISDNLGISVKRVQGSRGNSELSESQMTSEKGDVPGVDREAQDVWRDYVYHDLDDRSKRIYEWTTGYGGAKILPKKEIAQRLGISQAAVSSRVSRIQTMIREFTG